MINLVYEYVKDKFELSIAPTNADDIINLITSTNQNRRGFKFLCDFYLENQYVGTLKPQAYNGYGQVYVNSFTKNLLTWDRNFYTKGVESNPNSFKVCRIEYGEEYSRQTEFYGITSSSYNVCQGTSFSGTTSVDVMLLMNGQNNVGLLDRVYVVKDDNTINPDYSSYWRVIDIKFNQFGYDYGLVLNAPYNFTPFLETGYIYEGFEYYYYTNTDGASPTLYTTNPHNFLPGDQIILQMDNVWKTTVQFPGLYNPGDSFDRLQVRWGVPPLIGSSASSRDIIVPGDTITFSNTTQFVDEIVSKINCHEGDYGFRALRTGSGLLHIFTPFNWEFIPNQSEPSLLFTIGGTIISLTGSFYNDSRIDVNGSGFNPQASGVYTVVDVPASDEIRIDRAINAYKEAVPNAELGTIYSIDNYRFRNLLTGNTFSFMLARTRFDSEPFNDQNKFVTQNNDNEFIGNDKLNYDYYYDDRDTFTFDILNGSVFTQSFYSGKATGYEEDACNTSILSASGSVEGDLPFILEVVDSNCYQNALISGFPIPMLKYGCCLPQQNYNVKITIGTFSYNGDDADVCQPRIQASLGRPKMPYGPNVGGMFLAQQGTASLLPNVSDVFTLCTDATGFTYSFDGINTVTGFGGEVSFTISSEDDGVLYIYPVYELNGYMTIQSIEISHVNTGISSFSLETTSITGSVATYSITITASDEKLTLGFGPKNINEYYKQNPGNFSPRPIDYPIQDLSSYKIFAKNISGNRVTDIVNFTKKCPANTGYQIVWLNHLGGWNSISYDGFDYLINESEYVRSGFTKVPNRIDNKKGTSWNPIRNYDASMITDDGRRGGTYYDIREVDVFRITTPLLDREDAKYIREIFNSPEVYLNVFSFLCNNIEIIPVRVINESVRQYGIRDKLKQYTFEFSNAIYKSDYKNLGN